MRKTYQGLETQMSQVLTPHFPLLSPGICSEKTFRHCEHVGNSDAAIMVHVLNVIIISIRKKKKKKKNKPKDLRRICISSPPFPVPILVSNPFPASLPGPSTLAVVVLRHML